MRWAEHVARICEGRSVYGVLVGGPEIKTGRQRRRWGDNIKLDLRELEIDGANWIQLGRDRVPVTGFCGHGDEPLGSMKKTGYS
jgi:hypothetical protein